MWERYRFPVPRLDELDPDLVEILRDPVVPADLTGVPDELRPLIWLLERAWAGLYGTVTLEVFGHIDPRIVEQGAAVPGDDGGPGGPARTGRGAPPAARADDELLA